MFTITSQQLLGLNWAPQQSSQSQLHQSEPLDEHPNLEDVLQPLHSGQM